MNIKIPLGNSDVLPHFWQTLNDWRRFTFVVGECVGPGSLGSNDSHTYEWSLYYFKDKKQVFFSFWKGEECNTRISTSLYPLEMHLAKQEPSPMTRHRHRVCTWQYACAYRDRHLEMMRHTFYIYNINKVTVATKAFMFFRYWPQFISHANKSIQNLSLIIRPAKD